MTCRQMQSQMIELLDDGLRPQQAALLNSHLAGCAECQDALEDLRGFDALCQEHLAAPKPNYAAHDLLARLEEVEVLEPMKPVLPDFHIAQSTPRLATAALLVALAGSLQQSAASYPNAAGQQKQAIHAHLTRLEAELGEAGLSPDARTGLSSEREQA